MITFRADLPFFDFPIVPFVGKTVVERESKNDTSYCMISVEAISRVMPSGEDIGESSARRLPA
jgi:hypothetical protein